MFIIKNFVNKSIIATVYYLSEVIHKTSLARNIQNFYLKINQNSFPTLQILAEQKRIHKQPNLLRLQNWNSRFGIPSIRSWSGNFRSRTTNYRWTSRITISKTTPTTLSKHTSHHETERTLIRSTKQHLPTSSRSLNLFIINQSYRR